MKAIHNRNVPKDKTFEHQLKDKQFIPHICGVISGAGCKFYTASGAISSHVSGYFRRKAINSHRLAVRFEGLFCVFFQICDSFPLLSNFHTAWRCNIYKVFEISHRRSARIYTKLLVFFAALNLFHGR